MSLDIKEVKRALKITDYKYFGYYEFSGNQGEAVMVLEEIAKSLLLNPSDTGEVILKRAVGVLWKDGVDVGSCNKHVICPTYEELQKDLHVAIGVLLTGYGRLSKYQKTINQIDDYFEYSMDSKKDQKKIHQLLGNLTDSLKT